MKAVIMAGGEGSRLRPLTCNKPKPMVPVVNRPLMEYSVELLKRHGLRDIAVTLHYLPEQIKDHFGGGGSFGVNFRYYVEDDPLGTAGSVQNAAAFLDETFIVISGDALTDFDLTEAIRYHRARGAVATMVLKAVETPLEYGVVMIDPDGRINRFLEKPSWGEVFSDTVNTGIYILEPEVLSLVETGKITDFSKDIFPQLLARKDALFGCVLEGFWCDVGDIREYLRAQRQVLDGQVRVRLNALEQKRGIWLEEGVELHSRAQLQGPVYLGAGCSVGAGARLKEGTVLGSYTRVEERATVKRGLTWEGAYIGRGAALRGGILCTAARMESRSSVFEEAVIGEGSIIQEGVSIKPQVKVWPYKVVENGVTLTESLIWGSKASRTIFGRDGIQGEINSNITPEMAVRLGAVYGSMVNKEMILVSGDAHRASNMLREALIAGLISTGAFVLDAGELLIPMARCAARHFKVKGGIHVSLSPDHQESARIALFEGDGLPMSRSVERKIEQLYFREDFHRPPGSAVGEAWRLPHPAEIYRRELLQSISVKTISRAGFRIVLGNPSDYLRAFLVPLLLQLNCSVITHNCASGSGQPAADDDSSFLRHRQKELSLAVRGNNAGLGAIIDPSGEKALLFDEQGRAVHGDLYTALLSLLVFRERRGRAKAVPVNVSHVVERLADRYQGRVLRVKTAPRNLMEAGLQEEQERIKPTSLDFDGIAALICLLDLLAAQDLTLGALLKEIPSIKVRAREIPCPWSHKGRVMRRLIQETARNRTELIDGLKVYHPQGWSLILPDPDKPSYHVYSEGFSEEISAALTDFYIHRINLLKQDP
jgi:mannose-1-phosphate guanylyltransferase/phosphomannomutase